MTLTWLAALAVCAVTSAIATKPAGAAGAGDYKKWAKKQDDKKNKEDPYAKEIERLAAAAQAVEKEETAAQKALAKAEKEAAKKAADDAVPQERLVALARRKAVAALEGCGARYIRVLAAAQPIAKRPALSDKAKAALQTLAAKISMLRRSNVERIADLYEAMGKDRKALAGLEAYYRSLPERKRFAALAIKERIDALKEKTNPKRRAGAVR